MTRMTGMKKYRIAYWLAGDLKVTIIEANSKGEALILFYVNNACDDVAWCDEYVS